MTSALNVNSIDKESGSTLTLGTSGTTVDVPSGATLDVTGATVTGLTTGKVLQVVTATDNTAESTTTGSFVDTSLTASITCASTSNKVLVWAQAPLLGKRNDNFLYNPVLRFNESATSTNFPSSSYGFGRTATYFDAADGNNRIGLIHPCLWLHSPSSTSALTYTLQISSTGIDTAEYCVNGSDELAVMVLMEIAG